MTSFETVGAIISAGFIGAFGFNSCSNRTTEKFNVGDCIRDESHMGMDNRLGYFKLIVDKSKTQYVWCQGQHGDGARYNRWYGCDVASAGPRYINSAYEKVQCPEWTVDDDSPYRGYKSK